MNEGKVKRMREAVERGKARWAGISKAERSRQMAVIRAYGGNTPLKKPRCWCGKYTLKTAIVRNFDCCRRAGLYREPQQA